MLVGYARVSTADQDLSPQLEALTAAGCEKIFSDKASGAKVGRRGLTEALNYLRPNHGDILVIWKLDRLGRTMKGLVDLAADLAEKKIGLRSLTDGIDTSGAAGKVVFHLLSAIAEMERDLTRERTTAALAFARSQGRVGGRKLAMTPKKTEAARKLLASGIHPKEVASSLGVSLPTLYRHIPAHSLTDVSEQPI
jgi:DNA invertase Pin-like site-specific DNA recombinase